jgi:hypothetical protein
MSEQKHSSSAVKNGIGMLTAVGIAIAVQISWGLHHSILWATFHGLLNWIYVIYRVIVGD